MRARAAWRSAPASFATSAAKYASTTLVRQARSQGVCAEAEVAPAASAASATIPNSLFKPRAPLLRCVRLEPNDVARLTRELIVGGDVDEAVRALAHVADA